MENLVIANANTNMHGAQQENIFIAKDQNDKTLGLALIYPFFDYDLEPEHPHNLYLHLHIEQEEQKNAIKDALLDKAIQRAAEIKSEEKQTKTRLYACFLKGQQSESAYFLERGFIHDEGMQILERRERTDLPLLNPPKGLTVQPWKMETDAEQERFIEIHRQVFPRHPYSMESLGEIRSQKGWNNFTAFDEDKIVGNIMMFITPEDKTIGYIEDLLVLREWRQRGLGKYLLNTALTYFQDLGIQRVQLELWSANKNAFRLYHAFGFSVIDETEVAVGRYV